jgi:hypothetical protein
MNLRAAVESALVVDAGVNMEIYKRATVRICPELVYVTAENDKKDWFRYVRHDLLFCTGSTEETQEVTVRREE